MLEKLTSAFQTRFEDFRKHNADCQFFAHPFDLVVENIPSSFQLEIIELQANVDLKQAYQENDLLTFYRSYLYENYTHLENHADLSFRQQILLRPVLFKNKAVQDKMQKSIYR